MQIKISDLRRIIRESLEDLYNKSQAPLRLGSRGEDVRVVQRMLHDMGGRVADLLGTSGPNQDGVDGQYGPRTAAAVRRFQLDKGLEDDGVIGPLTAAALLGRQPVTTPKSSPSRGVGAPGEGEARKVKAVLLGDSQTVGAVGNALLGMIEGPAKRFAKTGTRPSYWVSRLPDALRAEPDVIFLTLGGNGTAGAEELLQRLRAEAPGAKIVWMGPPPADKPRRSNSMVSLNPRHSKHWEKRWRERLAINNELSGKVTGDNVVFLNAYDVLGATSPDAAQIDSIDGIHVRGQTAVDLASAMLNASK